jgi:hypothetical protein
MLVTRSVARHLCRLFARIIVTRVLMFNYTYLYQLLVVVFNPLSERRPLTAIETALSGTLALSLCSGGT